MHKFWQHPLFLFLRARKSYHARYLGGAVLLNFFAALLEGASFALLLLAFSILDGKSILELKDAPGLSLFPSLFQFLASIEVTTLFALIIVAAVVAQLVRGALSYTAQLLTVNGTLSIQAEAYRSVYRQIFRLSFPCVSQYKVGDLVEYTNAPANAIMRIAICACNCLVHLFTAVILLAILFTISWSLTLVVLLLSVVLIIVQKRIIGNILSHSRQFSEYLAEFGKHTVQSIQGMRAIHLFNRTEDVFCRLNQHLKDISQSNRKLNLWGQMVTPINESIGICLVGICLVLGPFFLSNSSLPILSVLLAFMGITYRMSSRVQILLTQFGEIAYYWGPIFRLQEILSDQGKSFIHHTGETLREPFEELCFEKVGLTYPCNNYSAVQEISFTLQHGSTVALVGPSGAGKSTIIDLISRLYDPTNGKIMINQRSMEAISISSWRAILGVVSQDSVIFNESVEENIRFGNQQLPFEVVVDAAKRAGAHSFISKLPEGYATVVGERGYRLSGGERQRIALARALMRDPELLILDEATSNLDSFSEHLIQDAIDSFAKKKTLVIVAHRLSTVVSADQILVMEHGKIVEQGTHQELLEHENGLYALLWKLQTEGHEGRITERSQGECSHKSPLQMSASS